MFLKTASYNRVEKIWLDVRARDAGAVDGMT